MSGDLLTTLRAVRARIAVIRDRDRRTYTFCIPGGHMRPEEAGMIAEYDAILATIDGALGPAAYDPSHA